jgi:hypothetical protein
MLEAFAETDTRLPPLERSRLGARGSAFASTKVSGLFDLFMAEAFRVSVYPGRFRSDEARFQVLGRTAGRAVSTGEIYSQVVHGHPLARVVDQVAVYFRA